MDQLFMALPCDLQWEVLSKFVGSHAVRNGRLKRKLVLGYPFRSVMNMSIIHKTVDPFSHSYASRILCASELWA